MTTDELPGGRLPLVLAFAGGATLFCAGLIFSLHGDAFPRQGLLIATGWGAVALALGIALRRRRPLPVRFVGTIWLLVGLSAWAMLWWFQHV